MNLIQRSPARSKKASEIISPFSRKGNGRVSGRENTKSCPRGAMGQKLQIEGELGMMFVHVRRVDGQASNAGQLFPFCLQAARYVRLLALSINGCSLLEAALSWSFSLSVVPGKRHQNMSNRKNAESRKLPGRGSGFSRKGSGKRNFMNKATKE